MKIRFIYFDTPGNLLNYYFFLKNNNLNISDSTLSIIIHFINQYKAKTTVEILNVIVKLIEVFYRDLTLKNRINTPYYFYKKSKYQQLYSCLLHECCNCRMFFMFSADSMD